MIKTHGGSHHLLAMSGWDVFQKTKKSEEAVYNSFSCDPFVNWILPVPLSFLTILLNLESISSLKLSDSDQLWIIHAKLDYFAANKYPGITAVPSACIPHIMTRIIANFWQ